ncbi:glycerol-3-phosphate 1-O-acyltransferase PlsY [uncultured Ilyobacter sp.]|uniref:glycerol-3-phosphate 1-O-acyltransferase PlsY n=1 Tax=uncultured Ilyobacter sp. TaxID=544433 RepID=UPI0029BFBBBD|nr:glycerol-3-phosphate 1-O-acyltransferase PlsY [uncultured Ilyobacter sp.]
MFKFIFFAVLAYVMGSIPTGVIIGKKLKGIDIREHGSKNSGATNAYRVLGARYGVMVLAADAAKGFFPVMLADLAGIEGTLLILVGLITIIGHSLSIFLKFKGGKGVATSLGVFLYLVPQIMLVTIGVFVIVAYFSKYVSLASVTCAALLPILTLVMPIRESLIRVELFIMTFLIGAFVIYRHRTNISRLMNGNENKFKFK